MRVIWETAAKTEMRKISSYCRLNVGITAYRKFKNCVQRQIEILALFPQIGQRELLLEGFPKVYRSLVVKRYHLKIVYCVDEYAGVIHISDIWDTRRSPRNLQQGIKAGS